VVCLRRDGMVGISRVSKGTIRLRVVHGLRLGLGTVRTAACHLAAIISRGTIGVISFAVGVHLVFLRAITGVVGVRTVSSHIGTADGRRDGMATVRHTRGNGVEGTRTVAGA